MAGWKRHSIETPSYHGKCRRDYFRVETWLPVRLSSLTPEGAERLARELDAPAEESATLTDPVLEGRLCAIEAKLDILLAAAGHEVEAPVGQTVKRVVEISGSGLRTEMPGVFHRGDAVRVELELPEERGRTILILGEVVFGSGAEEQTGRKGVALRFHSIRHRDREAIVRHAYEVQRSDLGRASGRESLR